MKLYLKYLSMHIKSVMEYKTSFILVSLGQSLTSLFSFVCIYFLFQRFTGIKGYTLNQVLLCFGIIFTAFSLAECFFRGFDNFSSIISNGEFDRILVRPRNEIFQVIGHKIEFTRVGRLVVALIILAYAIIHSGIYFTSLKILTLLLMIIAGILFFASLFMIYASICFFTTEGLEFMNIFTDGGRELAQYPMDIYKKYVLRFFTYVVPLAFVNYYPFLYLIDRNNGNNLFYILSPFIAMSFSIPSYIFWKFGLAHYKSIGS